MTDRVEAAVHAIKSYLGGKLVEGEVPFGPRLIPDGSRTAVAEAIAKEGFGVSFAEMDEKEGRPLPTIKLQAQLTPEPVTAPEPRGG